MVMPGLGTDQENTRRKFPTSTLRITVSFPREIFATGNCVCVDRSRLHVACKTMCNISKFQSRGVSNKEPRCRLAGTVQGESNGVILECLQPIGGRDVQHRIVALYSEY